MFKRFIAIILTLCTSLVIFSTAALAAENYNGGWAMSGANQTVYNNMAGSTAIGTIYNREGITVLSTSGNTAYIEYSTSNGAKRGYLINPKYYYDELNSSCVGRITSGCTVYAAPTVSSTLNIGSVYTNEYVAVLAHEGNWAYIEYNTNSGRKRGYINYSNLYCYNPPKDFLRFYQNTGSGFTFISYGGDVLAGPSEQYPSIGSLNADGETVKRYKIFPYGSDSFFYIGYTVNGRI